MTNARNVVVRGTNQKPVASAILAKYFESESALTGGQLFVGYPITTTADGKKPIDAIYLSPEIGVVVFDIVEGSDLGDFEDRQDDIATRLEVRLKAHRALVDKRKLLVTIHSVTFAPAIGSASLAPHDAEYSVANSETLDATLATHVWESPSDSVYQQALSAIQSISGIRKMSSKREVLEIASRGSKLKTIENSIATLDAQQSHAVIETVEGVQRIRGLAGSGKTVVLALKAAYLHAQHPEWRIAVTFNARSLRAQFTRLINTFTIEQTGEEPDWTKLDVLHSWGAGGGGNREGLYHRFCVENGANYMDFNSAKAQFGSMSAFEGACREALKQVTRPEPIYDVILADEAQDLPPEFLRICYHMLGDIKRLVYAYDELQTLNGAGLPSPDVLFGLGPDGQPLVSFPTQRSDEPQKDIILEKCYRNPRPVLVTAHALGFGIYRERPEKATTGLVQIFEQKELWDEIGYRVTQGELGDGHEVALARDESSSPRFLEAHSPIDDLIEFRAFDSPQEQAEWIADSIQTNLTVDELVADDIVVINPDPFTTRGNLGIVRRALIDREIDSHTAGVDVGADIFFKPGERSVTFTGIYRAKGNEAGMVYVANAHESFATSANLARVRNRLFTAITRSKAWVRVTGVGSEMEALIAEYERVKAANFELRFKYPTEEERATLQILHRDLTKADEKRVKRSRQSLDSIVEDLETRNLFPEDLDPETLSRLRRLLDGASD